MDGKPIFLAYRPLKVPDTRQFLDFWRGADAKADLPGLYLVAANHRTVPMEPEPLGFDAVIANRLSDTRHWDSRLTPLRWLKFRMQAWRNWPTVYDYAEQLSEPVYDVVQSGDWFPTVYPTWDTSPRHGSRGLVMHGSTPEKFASQLQVALDLVANRTQDKRLVFLKSWNEWAEGNFVEPDETHGHGYLDAIRSKLVA